MEIGVFKGVGSDSAKFSRSGGRAPRTIFALIDHRQHGSADLL